MRLTVQLKDAAQEMAREEIAKRLAFVSRQISDVRFHADGRSINCEVGDHLDSALEPGIRAAAESVQRAMRGLRRRVEFRSAAAARPAFHAIDRPDIRRLGEGQFALSGLALALFRYFDRRFETLGRTWGATPLLPPALIPSAVLAKCDYFRSFPQSVTFAAHLPEEPGRLDRFAERHRFAADLDDRTVEDFARPRACLTPALCYHVYHLNEHSRIPAAGRIYGLSGRCFRYESTNVHDLRRLWDFTMREIVFLGSRAEAAARQTASVRALADFLDEHRLAAEIRTACDPFFANGDNLAKSYFQLSSETKLEVSLFLSESERLACGSINCHGDFFGRRFEIDVEGSGPMHSACIGVGLERWVHAFFVQHGGDPSGWPSVVRNAPELTDAT